MLRFHFALQPREPLNGLPPMWVVYRKPRDWPDVNYVVRVWYGESATAEAVPFEDLPQARAAIALAGGSLPLPRSPQDDPAVLEVWV